jgi:ferrous iron transport protein A
MPTDQQPLMPADRLPMGRIGVIGRLSASAVSLKLLEMGCLPGKEIEIIRAAPMGSPLYLRVGRLFLALRPEEVAGILVAGGN